MMTKVLAYFALAMLGFLNTLGNFWFVYGIWPKSWTAFVVFFFTTVVLAIAYTLVKEDK